MKQITRTFYIIGGFFFLLLGMLGIVANFFPMIPFPTTKFLLLASFCFSRGSEKFDRWFKQTKIYEKYLADFVQTRGRGMTLKQKWSILLFASVTLAIPLILVNVLAMRLFFIFLYISKYAYLLLVVKTIKEEDAYYTTKSVRLRKAD